MSTVTIGCKIAGGLVLQSGRTAYPNPVTVNGTAGDNQGDQGQQQLGLTPGVDAGFWAAWLSEYGNSDAILNGQIFVASSP
jgi:hypothetical protein